MTSKSNGKIKYEFITKIWQHAGQGGWHFVSLPHELAKEIRDNLKSEEEGWGRLKATAKIGNSEWGTAIWFDTKMNTYLLPLKAEIRKKEKLETEQNIKTIIWI
ncbi:DUF1905 domain-containing protein [Flavobacterium maritimum]|jgi:hypothetical protein|uniref:DUF1905 domain-containing protein n=1 Tax=Flavobacterium maritimum TaxID=3149042 RepID=UPI0032B4D01C